MDTFVKRGRPKGSVSVLKRIEKMVVLRQEKRSQFDDDFEMSILPFQISKLPSRDFEELEIEEQIAFKALMVYLFDVTSAIKPKRLKAIAEMYLWMNDDARFAPQFPGDDGFEYKFDYWCEMLGVDAGYMRRKLKERLRNWTRDVKIGAQT